MPEDGRWKFRAEAVRLWVPIVVSLCAIGLTVFQARATMRHMRLSVQPRLAWNIAVARHGEIGYSLRNDGFGPAVLQSLTLELDGRPVGPDGPETCAKLDAALGRGAPLWETHCFDMEGDYVIRAGDTVLVYGSRVAPGAEADAEVTPEQYLRVTPAGTYCSFYDECWELK
jgi:hypothetical protein